MFESLERPKREGRMAQPVMSFAMHAAVIALAVGAGKEDFGVVADPVPMPVVIYDPATTGSRSEVETVIPGPVSPPVCECEILIPGQIELEDPKGRLPLLPGIPAPGLPGIPVRSIVDSGTPGVQGVYTENDLTDSPVLVHFPQPVYPPALKAAGVEGQVQIAYVVGSDGHVEPESISVVSSDHPLMSESVRVSLRAAEFRPGMVRGVPVRTLVRQTIRFSLMPL